MVEDILFCNNCLEMTNHEGIKELYLNEDLLRAEELPNYDTYTFVCKECHTYNTNLRIYKNSKYKVI